MSELLLTSSLTPVEVGQDITKSRHPWVTLQQYFSIPEGRMEDFTARLDDATEPFAPVEIIGTDEAEFGPNNDVRVRRITSLGEGATLAALHTVLGEAIIHHDGEMRNPEWAFEGYNPHITYTDGRALEAGEHATLETVELVVKNEDGSKTIQKVWPLTSA